MIIDKNGIINIQNLGLKLGPEVGLQDLKRNPHLEDFKYLGSNGDYVRYGISDAFIDDLPFNINLFFYKNKLIRIMICYAIFKSIGWEDWEKRKEQINCINKKHTELMINQHGDTKKKYPWGLIRSGIDKTHGYDSSISILYNSPVNELIIQRFKED